MKAITYATFGSPDVLELGDVPKPEAGPGQVLVRVRAASVNPWDWHFMRGLPYIARISGAGVLAPKHPILGGDIAGEVEAVGSGVTRFQPGDDVFGFIGFGGYAEFVAAPEAALAPKPVSLTFDEAATVPLSGVTALQGLRDAGDVQAGQRVLIIGASGGVGTFAVQLAKSFGATVTGVASTRSLDLVRAIGADHVLDYTRTDVARLSERYDLVLQLAGTASARDLRRILTRKGTLVLSSGDSSGRIIGPMGRVLAAVALKPFVSQRLRPLVHKPTSRDLDVLRELIDAGSVRPIIERTYSFGETPDAIRHVETGRPLGKVVVRVASAAAISGAISAAESTGSAPFDAPTSQAA